MIILLVTLKQDWSKIFIYSRGIAWKSFNIYDRNESFDDEDEQYL